MSSASPKEYARERSRIYATFCQLFDYPREGSNQNPEVAGQQQEYHRSFDCAAFEDACSLHGADHSRQDRNGYYEELLRFYNYYGLHRTEKSDLPDHLQVQLQFMHFLTAFEAECLGRNEEVVDLRRAQAEFLRRFLQPLSRSINSHLSPAGTVYTKWSDQLSRFIADDVQELTGQKAA